MSKDRHALIVPLLINDGGAADLLPVVERADRDPAFFIAVTGDETLDHDFNELSQHDLKTGELQFGLPAALIILLLVFGAIVAGLVPLLMAIVSIIVALGLTALVAQLVELSVFIVNMLIAMGLERSASTTRCSSSRVTGRSAGTGATRTRRSRPRAPRPVAPSSSAAARSSSRCSAC